MVQAIITLGEYEDRLLTIIKGKYGFKNKSDAINFVINKFEEDLEPEIRPAFAKKFLARKRTYTKYKTIEELRNKLDL